MVGNNIKRIREQKSISVNELSRLSGVNASYISALERGKKNNPSLDILQKIADALEITPKDLTSEPFANEKIPPNKFKSTCIDAVNCFGAEPQKRQTIEECSELIQALCKDLRGKTHNVEEEIADVMIMLEQLTCIYDNSKINKFREEKIDKLRKILEG
jgi:transcriptional regulator with XRE-family HTH domain